MKDLLAQFPNFRLQLITDQKALENVIYITYDSACRGTYIHFNLLGTAYHNKYSHGLFFYVSTIH